MLTVDGWQVLVRLQLARSQLLSLPRHLTILDAKENVHASFSRRALKDKDVEEESGMKG